MTSDLSCSTSYSEANVVVYDGDLARGAGRIGSKPCLVALEYPTVSSEKVLECVASAAM